MQSEEHLIDLFNCSESTCGTCSFLKNNMEILRVKANVRHWEDAEIDGVSDENGDLTPCRIGNLWCPEIDVQTGQILNWENGKEADIHFKVCDQCGWEVLDDNENIVINIENEYVPSFLSPGGEGYGDYIIMEIDRTGQIKNWKTGLSNFQPD